MFDVWFVPPVRPARAKNRLAEQIYEEYLFRQWHRAGPGLNLAVKRRGCLSSGRRWCAFRAFCFEIRAFSFGSGGPGYGRLAGPGTIEV